MRILVAPSCFPFRQFLIFGCLIAPLLASADEPTAGDEATASGPRPALRVRLVPEHQFTPAGDFIAIDLLHGLGGNRVQVERTWGGPDGGDGHFGLGWFDSNLIRIKQKTDNLLVVTRGPLVWIVAKRRGEGEFASQHGDVIRSDKGQLTLTCKSGAKLFFDSNGQLQRLQPKVGPAANFAYLAEGQLLEIRLGQRNVVRYIYEGDRVVRVEGPERLRADYVYESGRLVEVTNGWRHRIRYKYADDGTLLGAVDQYSNVTPVPESDSVPVTDVAGDEVPEAAADQEAADDRFVKKMSELRRQLPPPPVRKLDELGRLTRVEERGRALEFQYDADGRVQSETAADGVVSWTYDEFGRIKTEQQPDGSRLVHSWNKHDKPLRIESSTGEWEAFEYNEHGDLIRVTTSSGSATTYTWDARGRVKSIQPNVGVGEVYGYDLEDNVISIRYSDGRSVEHVYDDDGRRVSTTWSTGPNVDRAYDTAGRLVEKSVNGLRRTYEYDGEGRLVKVADPIHGAKVYDYSREDDKQLSMTWGDSTRILRTNAWADPIENVLSAGGIERRSLTMYDEFGQVEYVTSPTGRLWNYRYDDAGRRTGITLPGGQSIDLGRDQAGRLTKVTRDGVDYRTYLYDGNGRLQMEMSPAGIAAVYSWDEAGRVREVIEPDSSVQYLYDERGLVTAFGNRDYIVRQEHHPDGSWARRNYETAGMDLRFPQDEHGRPAGISLNEIEVRYEYDEFSRVNSIVLPGDARIWILRDQAGRPTEFTFGDNARMGLTWDHRDRLTSVGAASGPGNLLLFLEQYEYDPAGNLVRLQPTHQPASTMTYDDDDRLTQIQTESVSAAFEYDANDSLEAVVTDTGESRWDLDGGGRPTFLDTRASYNWDESGNLTATNDVRAQAGNQFDAAGRLVHRTVGQYDWSFGYLPDGDRLWQQGPQGPTWYAYLPEGLVALKDEVGTTWLVVNLPGTDRPLALCGPDGATLFVVADHLHSIRRLLDPTGQVLASTEYGVYGQVVGNVGLAPLAMFAGMVRDNHGLYYARRRYYDPALMRFISIDPWVGSHRFPASHNAYAYAANNPLRYRDPKGAAIKLNLADLMGNQLDEPEVPDVPIEELREVLEEKRAALSEAVEQWKKEVMSNPGGIRSPESWARINDELEPQLMEAWEQKRDAERTLLRAETNAAEVAVQVARTAPDGSSGTGQPNTETSLSAGTRSGQPSPASRDHTMDTGVKDNTLDMEAPRDATNNISPQGDRRRPPDVGPNDPTRVEGGYSSDSTLNEANQPRRQTSARPDDPTIAEGGNPNDRTLSERNQPRQQSNRRPGDRTLADVNPNDRALNELNRPRANPGQVDRTFAETPSANRSVNVPDRTVTGGAGQIDDILSGPNAPGGIAPRRGVGLGSIARRGARPLSTATQRRLLYRRMGRRLMQLGFTGTALGLLNIYDNVQTARDIYDFGSAYVESEQRRYRELANWDRRRRFFNAEREAARQLIDRIWAERNNPDSQWVIIPSVTINPVGTVTVNEPDRNELLNQLEQNVLVREQGAAAGRGSDGIRPLTGIARRRNDSAPVDFKKSLEEAKSEIQKRDDIRKQVWEMANSHDRALSEAEAKLELAEAGFDDKPKDFDALKEAEQKLADRIKDVKAKRQQRERALTALIKEIGGGAEKFCGQVETQTDKKRDGQPLEPRAERRKNFDDAKREYERLDQIAKALLEQTKVPLTELEEAQLDVVRRRSDLGNLSFLLDDDKDTGDYEDSIQAVRDKLAEAERHWDWEGKIEEMRVQQRKHHLRSRELLRPWLRNAHAQELWDKKMAKRKPLPEDERPTLSIDDLRERLQKMEEVLEELPADGAEIVKKARTRVDEANALLVELRSKASAKSTGLDQDKRDDVRVLMARVRGCAGVLEQYAAEEDNAAEEGIAEDERVESIVDQFTALDPTYAFEKQVWTLTLIDKAEKPEDPLAPRGTAPPEEKLNPFEKQVWTLVLKDKDPAEKTKPIVPVVPESTFRPNDFDIAARPNKVPTQPATKYPFEIARPQPTRQPSQPATKTPGQIALGSGVKTPARILTQPATEKTPREIPPHLVRPLPNLVTVPDVRGLSAQDAGKVISQATLGPSLAAGAAAPSVSQQYHVYAQQPAPGARVLPGSGVRVIYFNQPSTRLVAPARRVTPVPTIASTPKQSRTVTPPATKNNQPLVRVPTQPATKNPREIGPSVVKNRSPSRSTVNPSREITPTSPSQAMVLVPDVKGLTAAAASKKLRDAELQLKLKYGTDAPSKDKSYEVHSQSPKGGERVARNTPVEVTIYGKYRDPRVSVPSVSGLTYSQAASRLSSVGLVAKQLQGTSAKSQGDESHVYRQSPQAGSMVDEGSSVDVTVYKAMAVASRSTHSTSKPTLDIPAPTKRSTPSQSILGPWDSNWGRVVFRQDRGNIVGTISYSNGGNSTITGSFQGDVFVASWRNTFGQRGSLSMRHSGAVMSGNWTRSVPDKGTGTIKMTRADVNNRQTFNKAGVNITNRTGETLYLDIEYQSDKSGSWTWYSTRTTVGIGYNGPLKDSSGRTIAASSIKISTRGSSGRRYGILERKLVEDGPYDAETMGMHYLKIERRK